MLGQFFFFFNFIFSFLNWKDGNFYTKQNQGRKMKKSWEKKFFDFCLIGRKLFI